MSCEGDTVTSVGWSDRTNVLAVGTNRGCVQLWDTQVCEILCKCLIKLFIYFNISDSVPISNKSYTNCIQCFEC